MYYQGQPGGPAQPGSGQYMGAAPQMGYGTGPGALQPGAAFGGQQPQQIPPAGGFQQGMPPGGAAPPQGFSTAATQFGTGQPQLTAQQPTQSGGSLGQQPFPGSSAKPDSQDGVPPQPPAPVSNPMQTISSVPPQRPPPVKDSLEQRFQRLIPAALPMEMFTANIQEFSVTSLCTMGREIVSDLSIRTVSLVSIMRAEDRRKQITDVETVLAYCKMLFRRLVQIRIHIDKLTAEQKRMTDDELLAALTDPTEPALPQRKAEVMERFERNRMKIVQASNELKRLDWIAQVSDPRALRGVDATAAAKDPFGAR